MIMAMAERANARNRGADHQQSTTMYPESDDPSRPLWDDLELETQRCEVSAREVPARATNELYAVEVRGVLTRRECDALIAAT